MDSEKRSEIGENLKQGWKCIILGNGRPWKHL